ncbi:uncharacterized protein LOC118122919 isoform X2 [Hippoglossus stenolepis]|uniref:uncharacterized protein LOC118122919 isoform X2 n=1 Tax=Hippoglossus stenolepis TaxID=195615 RepID=UPI00159C6F56|nr:uncharacterized protein LOC118122919 isoform X2 [Hippoglossus stenolepis]
MNLACALIFMQLVEASAELIFRRLTENQSLELSCPLQRDLGSLRGLHLYHRGAQSQTTLLSMAEGGELRVDPERRGRLKLCGGLDSLRVNVTITHLQHSDTGLYMWELSFRGEDLMPSNNQLFLLVEGGAAGLIGLTLTWLATDRCLKARRHHRPQPPVPIYEEMTRKQQSAAVPQNNLEDPSHLEEDNFPLYANPNIRQPQDNYYACPRELSLRA